MVLKCKMCGGDVEQIAGTNTGKCIFCKSVMTLPASDNEKIVNLFNRANDLRRQNEFDKAYGIYETILEIDNEQLEAHWGLLLCKYGVEYVDDPKTGKKIPTCHRTITTSITNDDEFKIIKKKAYGASLELYNSEALAIDEIQKNILKISLKEDAYDIFICYKETDDNGERTKDSVIAEDIYDKLTEQGYKVFFARVTLEDKLGSEYEPYIFSALTSAKVMLVIGTSEKNFNAVWVKNEWARYIELMKKDKSKNLIPIYSDIDAYKLPIEFANLQAQSMNKIGAMQDLVRGIDKLIADSKNKKTHVEEIEEIGHAQKIKMIYEKMDIKYIILTFIINIVYIFLIKLLPNYIEQFSRYDFVSYLLPRISLGSQIIVFLAGIGLMALEVLNILSRKCNKITKYIYLFIITMISIVNIVFVILHYTVSILSYLFVVLPLIILYIINPRFSINEKYVYAEDRQRAKIEKKNNEFKNNFIPKEKILINKKVIIVGIIFILTFIITNINYISYKANRSKVLDDKKQLKIITNMWLTRNTGSGRIAYLKNGEIVEILNYYSTYCKIKGSNSFYKINYNNEIGYITSEYGYTLYDLEKHTVTVKTDYINVRKSATTHSDVIGQVKENEIYEVLNYEDIERCNFTFYVKTVTGLEGYVSYTDSRNNYELLIKE